jgi:hypothetical protein
VVSLRRGWHEARAVLSRACRAGSGAFRTEPRSLSNVAGAALATRGAVLYLVFGLWGVHILHVCRFRLVGWGKISALPDWQIPLGAAFWLGLVLLPAATAAAVLVRRRPGWFVAAMVVLLFEALSQTFGRSMFKLIGDLGVWGTILGGSRLEVHYGLRAVESLPREQLGAFHAECLGVLRTTVNVCLFVIGTLGIAVTSNLLSRYFDGPLGQGTAWVHVGTMLYLAFGMAGFIVYPLFRAVLAARERFSDR